MKDLIEKAESILSEPALEDFQWFIRGANSKPSFIRNLNLEIEGDVVRAYYDWIHPTNFTQDEKGSVRTWVGRARNS